jgi:hypothetical protein
MEAGVDNVTRPDDSQRHPFPRIDLHAFGRGSRKLARRSHETLLLSAVVGVITGAGVAGFETLVVHGLDLVNHLPLWGIAIAPLVGLTVAALALRWIGPASSPATADEYLHAFHDP